MPKNASISFIATATVSLRRYEKSNASEWLWFGTGRTHRAAIQAPAVCHPHSNRELHRKSSAFPARAAQQSGLEDLSPQEDPRALGPASRRAEPGCVQDRWKYESGAGTGAGRQYGKNKREGPGSGGRLKKSAGTRNKSRPSETVALDSDLRSEGDPLRSPSCAATLIESRQKNSAVDGTRILMVLAQIYTPRPLNGRI